MSSKADSEFIGFPPPLLGETPLRMPIVGRGADWVCLNKPAGPGVRAYPWDAGVPDLDDALNRQLQAEKPELMRLGAELFGSVYYMDPLVSGLALFGTSREGLAALRNRFGSSEMSFRFLFVAPAFGGELEEGFQADAPLLPHYNKPKMIPSTAKGKKSATRFHRLAVSPSGWNLWEALTTYPRPHQVRAHFALSGVGILGDALYGGPEVPTLKELMPKKRGPGVQNPVFDGVALHLSGLEFSTDEGVQKLQAALPRSFEVMLKRMQLPELPV